MTKNEAFEHLTSKRGWYKLCGISPEAARSAKAQFKKGKLSAEKINKLLIGAGYCIEIAEKWQKI